MIKLIGIIAALCFVQTVAEAQDASSPPTAELAKKCLQFAAKEHPAVVAGKKKGAAAAQREYFTLCLKKRGNMDDSGDTQKATPSEVPQ